MGDDMTEFCSICQRVAFGQIVPLGGLGNWRHDECALGSEAWKEYYLGLSPEKQKPLKSFFEYTYPATGGMQS
jgi:hypothetical protein